MLHAVQREAQRVCMQVPAVGRERVIPFPRVCRIPQHRRADRLERDTDLMRASGEQSQQIEPQAVAQSGAYELRHRGTRQAARQYPFAVAPFFHVADDRSLLLLRMPVGDCHVEFRNRALTELP